MCLAPECLDIHGGQLAGIGFVSILQHVAQRAPTVQGPSEEASDVGKRGQWVGAAAPALWYTGHSHGMIQWTTSNCIRKDVYVLNGTYDFRICLVAQSSLVLAVIQY